MSDAAHSGSPEPARGTGPLSVWRITRQTAGLGWLLPAMFLSVASTGMTAVAIAWLIIGLSSPHSAGVWVAAILLATYLPGLASSTLLHRALAHRSGVALVMLDAVVRAGCMLLLALLAATGVLTPGLAVVLVLCSAVTAPWGRGGMQAAVARLVRPEDRLAINSWAMSQSAVAMIIGPALGGVVAGIIDPFAVLIADAVLRLLIFAMLRLRVAGHVGDHAPGSSTGPAPRGWGLIMRHPELRAVLALTFGVAFCYGIFQVALPLLIAGGTSGGAELLGAAWAAFGVGSAAGAFLSSLHRRFTVWQSAVLTTVLWGLSVTVVGATHAASFILLGMLLGGLVYAPYQAVVTTFIQQAVEPRDLAAVGAAWSAALMVAQPLGYLAAGPATLMVSARSLVLTAAVATIAVGTLAMVLRPSRLSAPARPTATIRGER